MSSILKLEIASICIIHLVAILMSVACITVFFMKTRRDDHGANAFIVMQLAMIFWMVFKILKTVSPEINTRWFFILAYYACTCVLEVAFVEFGYAYSRGRPLSGRIRRFIYALPIMQFSWILTNPFHFQFYAHYDFWSDSFGPLFYAHMVIEYGLIGAGFFFCSQRFRREFAGKSKVVTYIVSTAIIIPLVLNLLFITKVIHRFTIIAEIPVVFDITPIVFTWSTLLFMYVTFSHDFFALTPLMRHEITHHMNLAIGVFDGKFGLGYSNTAFQAMVKSDGRMDKILGIVKSNIAGAKEFEHEEEFGKECFLIHCQKITRLTRKQYLVSIKEISVYKNIQADIMEKKDSVARRNRDLQQTIDKLQSLSRNSARKYVARELHDIIGHSLVTAVKLLEVSKIYMADNSLLGKSALKDASRALESGLSGIKSIPYSSCGTVVRSGEDLKKKILSMIETTIHTGVEVTLNFKGIIYLLDQDIYNVLDRTCTELITNCLKHARASRLFLSLKIQETQISLLAVDNGIGGGSDTVKGSGLSGMEERISGLSGTVHFSSSQGDGFMARITIPRKTFS